MKITPEIEKKINDLYLQIGTYSGVAKEIGCAPSTVKNHIWKNYNPTPEIEPIKFDMKDFPKELDDSSFILCDNYGELCELTIEEEEELKEFWKELCI